MRLGRFALDGEDAAGLSRRARACRPVATIARCLHGEAQVAWCRKTAFEHEAAVDPGSEMPRFELIDDLSRRSAGHKDALGHKSAAEVVPCAVTYGKGTSSRWIGIQVCFCGNLINYRLS
jgi:hypothetical protein